MGIRLAGKIPISENEFRGKKVTKYILRRSIRIYDALHMILIESKL